MIQAPTRFKAAARPTSLAIYPFSTMHCTGLYLPSPPFPTPADTSTSRPVPRTTAVNDGRLDLVRRYGSLGRSAVLLGCCSSYFRVYSGSISIYLFLFLFLSLFLSPYPWHVGVVRTRLPVGGTGGVNHQPTLCSALLLCRYKSTSSGSPPRLARPRNRLPYPKAVAVFPGRVLRPPGVFRACD